MPTTALAHVGMTWLLLRPKPPRPSAIRLILLTEILTKPLLFAANLQQHDNDKRDKYQQCLPRPEPGADAGVIDETPRQHGVAAQAVGAFRHQVLRAGRHLMPEGIHGVAIPLVAHVDDAPHAERQPEHGEHNGHHHPPDGDRTKVRPTRGQPHQRRDEQDKHQAAEGVTGYFSEFVHVLSALLSS